MRRRRLGRGLSVSMGTLEKFCISFWANRVFRAVSYLQALFEHAYEITALKEKPAVKGHCFGGNAGKAQFFEQVTGGSVFQCRSSCELGFRRFLCKVVDQGLCSLVIRGQRGIVNGILGLAEINPDFLQLWSVRFLQDANV